MINTHLIIDTLSIHMLNVRQILCAGARLRESREIIVACLCTARALLYFVQKYSASQQTRNHHVIIPISRNNSHPLRARLRNNPFDKTPLNFLILLINERYIFMKFIK